MRYSILPRGTSKCADYLVRRPLRGEGEYSRNGGSQRAVLACTIDPNEEAWERVLHGRSPNIGSRKLPNREAPLMVRAEDGLASATEVVSVSPMSGFVLIGHEPIEHPLLDG
jgi:hypothetical protein